MEPQRLSLEQMADTDILGDEQVAEFLFISRRTLQRLRANRKIGYYQLGPKRRRSSVAHLKEYLSKVEVKSIDKRRKF